MSDITAADQWLKKASLPQNGLASYLESLSLEWIVDGMLGEGKVLQSRVYDEATVKTLAEYLYRHTGMDSAFLHFFHGNALLSFSDLSLCFAAWLMCVYRKVVQELATGSCPRGALGDIIERWIASVENALIAVGAD